jgi:hypothetical protein
MEKKQGYRIAQYEQNLPEGCRIDEVRYNAKGGQRVNYVIGTAKVRTGCPGGFVDRVVIVTWDNEGLCRIKKNNSRLPKYDIKFEGR